MYNDKTIIFASDAVGTVVYLEDQDNRQARIKAVFQKAQHFGECPVSRIIENDLLMDANFLVEVPAATSREGEMTHMLVLANYAQREYAVRVMEDLGFKVFAAQLAQQPDIVHRDRLFLYRGLLWRAGGQAFQKAARLVIPGQVRA